MAKPLTMRIIDAVGSSELPQDLRLLLFVMAYLANSKTGVGLSGQETIGRFMGCTGREVRRKLDRLDELPDSPVRVVRRYRPRPDGRGRTSDEYQLELFNRTPTSAEKSGPTGRPRPIEANDQPDVKQRPTGRETPDQPDAHVRGSSEMILGVDPRRCKSAASAPSKPKSKPAPKPERTEAQKQAHTELTAHYFAEFEALRGSKPIGWGAKEGKAVHELLQKLKDDLPAAKRIVSSGLRSWDKATIMSISSNPSACVGGPAQRSGQNRQAADHVARQFSRVAELEAAERKALP